MKRDTIDRRLLCTKVCTILYFINLQFSTLCQTILLYLILFENLNSPIYIVNHKNKFNPFLALSSSRIFEFMSCLVQR